MITNLNNFVNESLGSSLALPANGLGGSRATSSLVAHFALQNTKFGSEKGKVQNPARIPPQTPPAGGKKAEAGQFHSPRKIVCPAESKLIFRILLKKCSNFVQKTPPLPRHGSASAECGLLKRTQVKLNLYEQKNNTFNISGRNGK